MTDADYKDVQRGVARKLAQCVSIDDLADKMLARADQGKNVVLSPGTAEAVGRALKGKRKVTTRA